MMEYLEQPMFRQYQQEHLHHGMQQQFTDPHQQHMQHYALAHPSGAMIAMTNHQGRANETKPRLAKEDVEILESEFKKNPKPTTNTKRSFAEQMGVELPRINNWFQNRRAKRKQENKLERRETEQAQESLAYSEPSSPDNFYGSSYFTDAPMMPVQHSATFPIMSGPPPPAASYNPQYSDPSSASMESLSRTLAAAQAASEQQDFAGQLHEQERIGSFGGPLLHDANSDDRAQFPQPQDGVVDLQNSHGFTAFDDHFSHVYHASDLHLAEARRMSNANQQTPFHSYAMPTGPETHTNHGQPSFPSQLLLAQSHDSVPSQSDDSVIQSPEGSNNSVAAINFKIDAAESESSNSPPAPTVSFKSPPPPTDLASRRKKANRPAALVADTLRGRPQVGPRTVSHADNLRRPSDSPLSSPMRRIVSAGGNRSVVSGRIGKPGVESAQRSPININGFHDARAFLEHNLHTTQQASMTAGSSLNSSLSPPTPLTPFGFEQAMMNEQALMVREGSRSTTSSDNNGMNFMFNTNVSGSFSSVGDQNMASPPETPQALMMLNRAPNGWPTASDYEDKAWTFDVPDEPLYTPASASFPPELQMSQPPFSSYLSSSSQPVTPAFGQFNANFTFGSDSPHFKSESPQYLLPSNSEYSFPESNYTGESSVSPVTKPKTFQFTNITAADFSEK